MKYLKPVCIIVLLLNLRVILVLEYIVDPCSEGCNDIRFLKANALVKINQYGT